MRKRINHSDRGLERFLVYTTGALAASAARLRRQASFTIGLHRAIIAVLIALLLFSAALFWNAIRSAVISRKELGPKATDSPIGQSHSADPLSVPDPHTKRSFSQNARARFITTS